jgi:hypothetical protein
MLDIKTRQAYLKELGFYTGAIDGLYGPLTKAAYLGLQRRYFTRKEDIDGRYGPNTDTLLVNAYNIHKYTRHFDLTEFKCNCGKYCTGYPVVLDIDLLENLQSVRDEYGPTSVTSGMRCERHNAAVGGASGSRHKRGKAADIYNAKCKTEAGRKSVMAYWGNLPSNRYTYCNIGGNYPGMGNAVHVDVK